MPVSLVYHLAHLARVAGVRREVRAVLNRYQTEQSGKAFWDAEQFDRHLTRSFGTRIASEPFCPGARL
jgi:hypothetical protein